jgi:hypothetical protein
MSRLWTRWVDHCGRLEDSRALGLVRIGVAACILLDLLRVAWLGLVPQLFRLYSDGGINKHVDSALVVDAWLGIHTGPVLFGLTVLCMLLVMLGRWTVPAILIGVLAYAQLGHLYPPGDRGIDRILRTTLLILMFSQSHRRISLDPRPMAIRMSAWPKDLIRFLLVMVYLSAGTSKLMTTMAWVEVRPWPVLYRIMTDPLSGHISPEAALWAMPLFHLGSWATVLLECSSPLLLTRWRRHWALLGVGMHLGIAATMELGMFSWGMLALYPVLLCRDAKATSPANQAKSESQSAQVRGA